MLDKLRKIKYYKLYKPSNARLYLLDKMKFVGRLPGHQQALENVFQWIEASLKANGDGGSAAYYTLGRGWKASYPETTGYLIPTLYEYADYSGSEKWSELARSAGEWLLSIQFENGAWQGGQTDSGIGPRVFNTAMILDGMVECYEREGDDRYLKSGERGVHWLLDQTNSEGLFVHNNVSGGGSFDLLSLACMARVIQHLDKKEELFDRIRPLIDAHIQFQTENHWWRNCNFEGSFKDTALLHHLGYTLDGLVILSEIMGESRYFDTAYRTARKLMSLFEVNGTLPAYSRSDWTYFQDLGGDHSYCLTGYSQLAIVFLKIARIRGDQRYQSTALKIIDIVSAIGNRRPGSEGVNFGLAGSFPIFGNYQPYQFVNWAAKYHAESILNYLGHSSNKRSHA
jgi:uncharacterized protein YyaL (SSP411 family)